MTAVAAALALFAAAPAATPPQALPVIAGTVMGPALRIADAARSSRFYSDGLGMLLARRIELRTGVELIFTFRNAPRGPVILLFTDGAGAPLSLGNGYGRTLLAVTDAAALAARLKAAGYAPGETKANDVNGMKTFWVKDPDGYGYEITERPDAAR